VKLGLYVVPIVIAIMSFLLWRSIQKYRNNWETYAISLTDEGKLSRSQGLLPTVTYDLNQELLSINENSKGQLMFRFKESNTLMVVPKAIENRADLIERLEGYAVIGQQDEYGNLVKLSWALNMLALAAAVFFYISTDKWTVGITGMLLVAYLLWVFVVRQRNSAATASDKRRSFVYLALMALVGYKLWLILA